MELFNDYPTKPIGGGNPYRCCVHCGVSEPAINGNLENHQEWCEYRKIKTLEQDLELARLEIECLKLDAQKPVYCVARAWSSDWSSEFVGSGADLNSVKLFRVEREALAYKAELEASPTFDPDYSGDYVEVVQRTVSA